LKNAINPGWVVSPISSSVMISTKNIQITSIPTIDEIITGVLFTPAVIPGILVDIGVLKDLATNKVGEATHYNISFTVVTVVPSGGQVVLTFPSEAVYKAAATEVVCKNATSTVETCVSVSDSSNNVQTITISTACTSG
jgi:hypothetical protein